MAAALAGCATADPPAVDVAPSCDLICQIVRLFAPDPPPPPPPAPSLPPAPVKVRHARGSTRPARRAPDVAVAVVPPLLPDEPPTGPFGLRPTVNPMFVPIPGSPGITPPWFEPPLPE